MYLILGTEGNYLFADEVRSVGYNGVWEAKVTYEVLSHKFDHLLPCDLGEAQL